MSIVDKVKHMLGQNTDKAKQGVEKAGDVIDERTGGKYADKVDKVQGKVGESGRGQDDARQGDMGQSNMGQSDMNRGDMGQGEQGRHGMDEPGPQDPGGRA